MLRVLSFGMALTAFGVCTLVALATTSAAHHHGEAEFVIELAEAQTGKTYVATVEGMTCAVGCAPKVEEALRGIEGVESVKVDFDKKQAVIRTAPGHSVTRKVCDEAFGNSGYFVDGLEELKADAPGA